ncbi:hypothetical protein BROSI_A2556 [Candidatus Brocadia sinica JPN1]|uniref:Uncharacterized protein n=1 Tax=Candidatus Brocadia sinica JPN1 TaxID=1197129 RepID=A0ABQ0JZA5_9BACT|nr:hypothetical protein BROSI_A2556 [Candidatus Brocadia sinica JPN1]GIK14289.1 MAG: hypothetical protein BroJett002_29960 [Candidatus Brocadia sinica]
MTIKYNFTIIIIVRGDAKNIAFVFDISIARYGAADPSKKIIVANVARKMSPIFTDINITAHFTKKDLCVSLKL